MTEQPASPTETLNRILESLKGDDPESRLAAIQELHQLNYTSAAIRAELERLALKDDHEKIRTAALATLDLPTNRHIRSIASKLGRDERYALLKEIEGWVKSGLLDKIQADVLKRRYDFDISPLPIQPVLAPVKETATSPTQNHAMLSASSAELTKPASALSAKPIPAGPRPTLLQTLLSETSIKIALYLGAFFVIASAVILGALVEAARLPTLIIGTIIFGIFSVAIRKRLPQPSFALFIVFSFLLPITANVIEESLKLSSQAAAGYWTFVSLFMAVIWGVSAWLYGSRLFSITSFIALTTSFYNLGGIFKAEPEFNMTMMGIAALAGLFGARLLKAWKDNKFALPLFISAQILQGIVLLLSIGLWLLHPFESNLFTPWNLASVATWGLAFIFFLWSDALYPFIFFRWFAATALIPIPWFGATVYDAGNIVNTILFFAWGMILAVSSEAVYRVDKICKYCLPILIASSPAFMAAIATGFAENRSFGFGALLGIAMVYGVIHAIRPRGLLWAASLLAAIGAYFTFFELPFLQNIDVFSGFIFLGLSILLLLPDLILKADFAADKNWRLPLRIFGALLVLWTFVFLTTSELDPLININTAIVFGVYAVFFTIYSIRYTRPLIGYLATLSLTLSVLYTINYFDLNIWLESLTALSVLYYFAGFTFKRNEMPLSWGNMLKVSGLILGSLISLVAILSFKDTSGWYVAVIGALFIVEMHSQKQSLFELGAHFLFPAAFYLILRDLHLDELAYILFGFSLIWLGLDLIFSRTFKSSRRLELPIRGIGALAAFTASLTLIMEGHAARAAICFGILTVFFSIYTLVQRKAILGYISAAYLPLTVVYTLQYFNIDAWLPALTGLAVIYFGAGFVIRTKANWSLMLRNSALTLGTLVTFVALINLEKTGGWYVLVVGLIFITETFLRSDGRFEIGAPILFSAGAFLILQDLNIKDIQYTLLITSLVWLGFDLIFHKTFTETRPLKWIVRGLGAVLVVSNVLYLFSYGILNDARSPAICFGIYSLFFITHSLLYRVPRLGYTFTITLPLFVFFVCRDVEFEKWLFPIIAITIIYYAIGYVMRRSQRGVGWDVTMLFSGLGLGTILSFFAPFQGGLDSSLPVAIAATLWALEAFTRKNVWLGFPANVLYLLAYFMILIDLKVDEPQYFSIGAAILGMIMHYLLTRAGSKTGALITGMVSQLVLLGTTYIQMLNTERLIFFVVLFFQSLAVLIYGIVIRSRSLVLTPIVFSVLGVVTVVYSALKGISTVVLIGCTGIILLMLGILAVVMRERITRLGERLSDWQA